MTQAAIASKDQEYYAQHVNPQWVRLLDILKMNVSYERCSGVELLSSDRRRFLDFLSGYCVHNVGHNHPAMFGQVLVMRMFNGMGILTQTCGHNFMMLTVAPPLIVQDGQIEEFVSATKSVVESMHVSSAYWTDALGLARRAIGI